MLFPLFNRDRLRLGDLAGGAGTMVIKAPRRVLRPDLAQDGQAMVGGPTFTEAQLDAYGVKELHVLENVLRGGDRRTVAEVATRIRAKIGWDAPLEVSDRAFLNAYYAGLRARLEGRLLFGHRRADKFDRPLVEDRRQPGRVDPVAQPAQLDVEHGDAHRAHQAVHDADQGHKEHQARGRHGPPPSRLATPPKAVVTISTMMIATR